MKKLIVLTGPTAVGKTELSIKLAEKIGGEIISADSMQVYRYMDIGSAKIKKEEMNGITHHLIDILNPDDEFNVVLFQQMAKKAMESIYQRGHIPIITGGTGFYIQAILYDIDFSAEESNVEFRTRLEQEVELLGAEAVHKRLEEVDPISAQAIHPNNVKRVIRALEFYELNGYPISEHNEREHQRSSPYEFNYFVLTDKRERLYKRIDQRVDEMLATGLVDEVKRLKNMGYQRQMVSMQGLGYKEILDYLDGKYSLDKAIYLIKRDTRHFAKRQLTWFRRERDVTWINKEQFDYDNEKILDFMESSVR